MKQISDDDLWIALASEGNFSLIEKLQRALNREPGFGTIVVTRKGFSENDKTHNMVINWLKDHPYINVLDIMHEIGCLEEAARPFYRSTEND